MANIYIDESGSMCINPINKKNNYFFIALVKVNKSEIAKKRFKRFISKNIEELKKIDVENKMFINGKFKELKGSALTFELKEKFVRYMCSSNCIEVYLIKVDNNAATENFFDNTARAFNFLLKLGLQKYATEKLICENEINLHLDNRNVRTNTIYLLEEYLNTELATGAGLYKRITATYYQSENCRFVQIADVFANIHFSSQFNKNYNRILKNLVRKVI
ncbi:DUF3800 domain-containing protein [Amedibacillus sp. YH-ame6]